MKRILLLFIALAAVWGAAAKIRLPEIIGNDMVLQQNAEVRLWGWAEPYAAVKVETSWGAGAAVKSDAAGSYRSGRRPEVTSRSGLPSPAATV